MNENSDVSSRPIILLTGCINPEEMPFTKLLDPEKRKLQYIDAIKFYLDKTDNLIVFVENSGVDISEEFNSSIHKERLEIITFLGNNFDKHLGKGYGEMLILKYAFTNSDFIKRGNCVCKVTGRYKVLNIKGILRSYEKHKCNVMVDLPRQLRYADSRIFIADKMFFNKFLFETTTMINDSVGYYFEHALNKAVLLSIVNEKYLYLPFKYNPRLKGESGTDSLNYEYSLKYWLPQNILQILQFKLFLKKWDIKYRIQ